MSAAGMARATGLSRDPTISMALAELRRARVVVEAQASERTRGLGRPASAFALNPEAGTCLGLHLGRETMRLVIADVSHSVVFERNIPLGLTIPRPSPPRRRVRRSAPPIAKSAVRKAACSASASRCRAPSRPTASSNARASCRSGRAWTCAPSSSRARAHDFRRQRKQLRGDRRNDLGRGDGLWDFVARRSTSASAARSSIADASSPASLARGASSDT